MSSFTTRVCCLDAEEQWIAALEDCVNHEFAATQGCMDRHQEVIQDLKGMVWDLEGCVLKLERENIALELGLEQMSK